jgi:putative aldouronate transport system permease protein
MIESKEWQSRIADGLIYLLLLLIALTMLFPFLYVFVNSFSTFRDVARGGINLWPEEWSIAAYRQVLSNVPLQRSFGVSVFVATVGTVIQLAVTAAMAYALASPHMYFRRFFLILVLIPLVFWPGMIPRYLVVKSTGLLDSVWSLIIPGLVNSFNLIVMRNYFMELPQELFESAELEGANDLGILWHIVLPLSKPILAAIGLFYAVANWNNYFGAILFLNDSTKWPMQVLLRSIVLQSQTEIAALEGVQNAPLIAIQMATVIVATVPILVVYPFLQKYFVKGTLTGAIKG